MREYARIENNTVVEIISLDDAIDIATAFHPDLVFMEVTGVTGVAVGWVVSGNTVVPPGPPPPPSKVELIAYAAMARSGHAGGGVTITSLSAIPFSSDLTSRNTINSAYDYANANPAVTVHWKMSDGSFITVDQAKLTTMANDIAGFVQACFTCEANTVTSINGGSITTTAEIDAAFAAISNVYP